MTKIKLCGLSRPCDIEAANRLEPEYIGFVFAAKSCRHVTCEKAAQLKELLSPGILAVGVFVKENVETVADLLNRDIIDIAQLHGTEGEEYISHLKSLTDKPIIKAFCIDESIASGDLENSSADYILLDSGRGGTGKAFNWELIQSIRRPYFLAGGLGIHNVGKAVKRLNPYGVDVSSGIETDGWKDPHKMAEFVAAVRGSRALSLQT